MGIRRGRHVCHRVKCCIKVGKSREGPWSLGESHVYSYLGLLSSKARVAALSVRGGGGVGPG